jgi:chemotaxis protein methyltransferase CheR
MTSLLAPSRTEAVEIADAEFQKIRKMVYDHFGINLTDQKRSLVVGRLQKVLRSRGMTDYRTYVQWLENDRTGEGLEELANRISTNHTFFFREKAHFEYFQGTALPEISARRRGAGGPIRIWCAGCSSGEEPYTLAMLMREHLNAPLDRSRALLLATDLSAKALQTAMHGVYSDERLEQMPPALRSKYFKRHDASHFEVTDEIRQAVVYRRHNLMDATYPFKHAFDAVFCRNVMIYFDRPTRDALIAKFHRHTVPGGYLFIGHSETLGRDGEQYQYIMPAAYRRGP